MSLIYILEDDESLREVLNSYIKKHGYQTESFSSPDEAVSSIKTTPPDALVSDVNMPGMSGLDVVENLRKEGILIPVILLSADVSRESREKADKLDVRYFFKKPIKNLSRLSEALDDELTRLRDAEWLPRRETTGEDFFMEMSHELRTPLTSLRLVFDGLSIDDNGNGDREKLISIGRKNLDRIISIVEQRLRKLSTNPVE